MQTEAVSAVVRKIDVFDAKPSSFQQAKTAAVKQIGHETIITFEMSQHGARFAFAKDDGKSSGAADAFDAGDEFQFAIEDLLIKKEQCAESLILSGGGDPAIDGEVAQESGDFFFAHLLRMTFVVEKDVAANPINISLLGADAVALDAQMPAYAVEEFGRRSASSGRGIFSDAKGIIGLGDDREGDAGRLPLVVSPVFVIKAAHWFDLIKFPSGQKGKSDGTREQVARASSR